MIVDNGQSDRHDSYTPFSQKEADKEDPLYLDNDPHEGNLGNSLIGHGQMDDSIEDNPFQRNTDITTLDHISAQNKKSFIDRNFSKLTKGGLRSSLFTLFSGTVGAGLLSLPKIFSYYGMAFGLFSILSFALLTFRIYWILNEMIVKSGKKSYANMCAHYLGRTPAKIIIQFLIFTMVCSGILYGTVGIHFFANPSLAVRRGSPEEPRARRLQVQGHGDQGHRPEGPTHCPVEVHHVRCARSAHHPCQLSKEPRDSQILQHDDPYYHALYDLRNIH